MKFFLKSEEGMGTIEIVIIIAILVALAFLFRGFIIEFFNDLTSGIRNNPQIDDLFSML